MIQPTVTPYPSYKDSGIEWLGEIPVHWENIALKRLVAAKITDGPHETPEFLEEGVPFVSAEAIVDGKIDFSRVRGFISKELDNVYSKKCKPKRGDIFIVKSGSTTGKVAIVDTDEDFNIWSPIALVRAKKTLVFSPFFFLAVQADYFRRQVELYWSFGTQPNIGMGVLENLRIMVPPLPEQRAIAAYLDHKTQELDELIADKRRLIELYQEERSALINQAVTRGLDPDAPMKDSGIEWLGEVPSHWEVKRLKYLAKTISKGTTPSTEGRGMTESGIRFIKAENIVDNRISKTPEFFIDSQTHKILKRSQLEPNDILFVIAGATIGKVAIIREESIPANTNQAISFIRLRSKEVHHFVTYWLQSTILKEQMWLVAVQSAQPNLSMENLGNFPVPYPPVGEQYEILAYLNTKATQLNQQLTDTEREIELLQEYRTALISEVVTGKVDVRGEANRLNQTEKPSL